MAISLVKARRSKIELSDWLKRHFFVTSCTSSTRTHVVWWWAGDEVVVIDENFIILSYLYHYLKSTVVGA